MSELDFLAGNYFQVDLPREMRYLEKYFYLDVQSAFLYYYYTFGSTTHFVDHTGHVCSRRHLRTMKVKYKKIVAAHQEAKKNFDIEKVALIEGGKYKWRKDEKHLDQTESGEEAEDG